VHECADELVVELGMKPLASFARRSMTNVWPMVLLRRMRRNPHNDVRVIDL
jgi:hypothetical protein